MSMTRRDFLKLTAATAISTGLSAPSISKAFAAHGAKATVVHLGLCQGQANRLVEVAGGGYKRQPMLMQRAKDTFIQTDGVEFPQATGGWGRVTHYAVFNGPTGNKGLAAGEFIFPKSICAGDTARIEGGNIWIRITDPEFVDEFEGILAGEVEVS